MFGLRLGLGEDRAFMRRAACLAAGDPDLFYAKRRKKVEQAKEICLDCPVMVDCLRYAIKHEEIYGIWGGMDLDERNEWRKSNA